MKKTHQKLLLVILILIIQVFGIFLYVRNEIFITEFKKDYVMDLYFPILKYKLSNIGLGGNPDVYSSATAEAVPALLYHSILTEPDGENVLVPNFTSQMIALKKAGYNTIYIDDFYNFMQEKKTLPEKSILITFDDGPKNSYYPVEPLLKTLGFNAVSYIITKYALVDKSKFYLTTKELEKMKNSGHWELQFHAKDGHTPYRIGMNGEQGRFYPNKLWLNDQNRLETIVEYKKRIKEEITNGKADLEKLTEEDTISYAFPFGDYGQNYSNFPEATDVLLAEINDVFPMVFYQVYTGSGYSYNYPDKNEFMMKRIIVRPDWSAEDLLHELEKGRPKQLPFYTDFAKDRGWEKTWGKQIVAKNKLELTTDNSEGGSVILDGSYNWKDYNFTADIDWDMGDSFTLIARYIDGNNYVACNITDETISVQEIDDAINRNLSIATSQFLLRKGVSFKAGLKVIKDEIECSINEETIVNAKINPKFIQGGIGFKNWAVSEGNSRVYVKSVEVIPE